MSDSKFGISPLYLGGGVIIAGIIAIVMIWSTLVGHNQSGQRTFVQTWLGDTSVTYKAGPYWLGGGYGHVYNDYVSHNFTPADGRCEYERGDGLKVQYQDGGFGVVCGQIRIPLPGVQGEKSETSEMEIIHNQYKSLAFLKTKLISKNTQEILMGTAELMTSTETYQTKRSEFKRLVKLQFDNGSFLTDTKQVELVVSVDEKGKEEKQKKDVAVVRTYPKDHENAGNPMHGFNKFASLGITEIDVTITGFDFEPKTMRQIEVRRDAQNRAMTAKDQAKAAFFEKKRVIAEGEKNVAEATAQQEVIAQKAIVAAQRDKELAIIRAEQKTAEAEEMTKAAVEQTAREEELAKAAEFTAEKIVTIAKAEAFKRKSLIKADNGFKLQLENDLAIATVHANGMARMNMPLIMNMGGGGGSGEQGQLDQLLQFQVLESVKKAEQNASRTVR